MILLSFTLTIAMQSDWHLGSGQGRHRSIDRLIDRDHDGLPFIPAATLRGLWRDGAEALGHGLDDTNGSAWISLVVELFGSQPALAQDAVTPPLPSRLTLTDARLPARLRQHLAGDSKHALRQALTFVKPGVSIGHRSGRARTDFLRFEEVARAGAILCAEGSVSCPAAHRKAVAAFLVGAAALVERLGGKRRRGMGKCKLVVSFGAGLASDGMAAADVLSAAEAPVLPREDTSPARQLGAATAGGAWTKIALRLTLLSPVVVADEVQGNVVTCQDLIPAGYLLPYVARALETAGIRDAWSRVSTGDVRVLPATPAIAGRRSVAVPMCWEKPKGERSFKGLRVVLREPTEQEGSSEAIPQYESVRTGFVTGSGPVHVLKSVPKILRTHNTIQDEIQRPHEDVGGVYTYEAIAAGQVFLSEVWIRGVSCDAEAVRGVLAGEARLGRARQAGYGRVAIDAMASLQPLDYPDACRSVAHSEIRVWLASDMVVAPGVVPSGLAALADAIAAGLGRSAHEAFDLEASWGSIRWRRIESWQSQWGLPRPTLVALQAGSVASLKLRPGIVVGTERLEAEGLGERKGEGFGCVIFNHSFLAKAPDLMPAPPEDETAKREIEEHPLSAEEEESCQAFLRDVRRHAWERCIALRAEFVASRGKSRFDALGWEAGRPNMSQLGALRAAMGELSSADLTRLTNWLEHLKGVSNRADKWPSEALNRLGNLLANPGKVWPELGLDAVNPISMLAGAPVPSTLEPLDDDALTRFALRTLLLQSIRYHKREQEKAETGKGHDADTAAQEAAP